MNKLNVAFIARNFPPKTGGAEKLNYELAQQLGKLINLKVLANKWGKYSPIFYAQSFFKVLFDRKVNLIFLSDAVLAPLIPFFRIFKRKPIVLKIHGLDITFDNSFYQFFIPKFIKKADRIICISNATKKECIKRNIRAEKCVVISIGIEMPKISKTKEELRKIVIHKTKINLGRKKIILSVGALVERKGFHWFIKYVITELLKKRNDFIYLIAGGSAYKGKMADISYHAKLISFIKNNHIGSHVKILGRIDDKLIQMLYSCADLYIMPNIPIPGDMEGFGIVAIEASSYGLPVIASKVEGIKEAICDEKNGFLVDPLNTNQYIRLINEFLDSKEKRKNFGQKAKNFTSKNYNWSKIIQEYISTFNSLS
jgi:glycosyltransferase involved in cell wall biosynthesis